MFINAVDGRFNSAGVLELQWCGWLMAFELLIWTILFAGPHLPTVYLEDGLLHTQRKAHVVGRCPACRVWRINNSNSISTAKPLQHA